MTDETRSVMATNCLGCFTPEGSMHKRSCPWYDPDRPTKTLKIDLLRLIEAYGLEPRWASLDALGTLTVAGSPPTRRT